MIDEVLVQAGRPEFTKQHHIKAGCGDTQLLSQATEEETEEALGLTNHVGQVPERNPISRNKKIGLEVERTCREL